jgi:hypothetical protein
MQSTLEGTRPSIRRNKSGIATLFLALSLAASTQVLAESAYIPQISGGSGAGGRITLIRVPSGGTSASSGFVPTPETARPSRFAGSLPTSPNFAQTLVIGNGNATAQIQLGSGDISNLGILGGSKNNVTVLQGGNNLRSNLVLLNPQGLTVGVIQPNGSAPVNALIARLPNGGLLIKR